MRFRENNPSSGSTKDRHGNGHQALQLDGQFRLLTV